MKKAAPLDYKKALTDNEEFKRVIKKYNNLLWKFSKGFGQDSSNIYYELWFVVWNACSTYDETRASFITHLYWKLWSYTSAEHKKRGNSLEVYVPNEVLDETVSYLLGPNASTEYADYIDTLIANSYGTMESVLLCKLYGYGYLLKLAEIDSITRGNRNMRGYSVVRITNDNISSFLGVSVSAVKEALSKIRKSIANIIKGIDCPTENEIIIKGKAAEINRLFKLVYKEIQTS